MYLEVDPQTQLRKGVIKRGSVSESVQKDSLKSCPLYCYNTFPDGNLCLKNRWNKFSATVKQ